MEKNKKNIWIIIGIVIILAFITLLFILKKENKTEVKNENEAKTYQNIKYGRALYSKLGGIYFRDDLTFEQENNKNKVYKIEGQDYYKLLDKEYVKNTFTDQGFVGYKSASGLIIKDDEYYLPVVSLKHNELVNDREFEVVNEKTNEAQFEITTSFCSDKERCTTTTKKRSNFKIKKVDGEWLIDSFEIDE